MAKSPLCTSALGAGLQRDGGRAVVYGGWKPGTANWVRPGKWGTPERSASGRRCLHMANTSHVKAQIARQIFIALQRRGADKLLSIIESYRDRLSDAEILLLLQEYNMESTSPAADP